jgi:uncharacterized protein YbjT (DUF2867 family)
MSKIAVAGGTGRVGTRIVEVLREQGHEAVPMSRATGVDVITGEGLAEALDGVEAMIDAATGPSPEEGPATDFFVTASRNLHEAGQRAGVKRMLVISIIGIDRGTNGYGRAKLAHEREALAGPLPTTILRAAQFHELVPLMMGWGRDGDVIRVPEMRSQIVAAKTVAEEAVRLVTQPETGGNGLIPEIAGPREESFVALARLYAERGGDPVTVEVGGNPGDPGEDAGQDGSLLPSPHAKLAGPTFEEWLETQQR